jgi:hypothetical protein
MTDISRLIKLSFAFCTAAVIATAAGCSSDDDNNGLGGPNKCGQVSPCGGKVVGDWNISGACVDPDAITNQDIESIRSLCPTIEYETSYTASGSASFTETSYTLAINRTVTATVHVPASCLTPFGLTCSTLNGLLQQEVGGSGSGDPTISCSGSGSCTCIIAAPQQVAESGTYTTSGTTLTTTPSGSGAPSSTEYCVDGSTLHVIEMNEDGSGIVSDVIGKK